MPSDGDAAGLGADAAHRPARGRDPQLKLQLQGTIEQSETSTEELKASNEELQAINEELRSATEELETSKEELQSINEELITVNYELKIKVEETGQDQRRPAEPDRLDRHRHRVRRPRHAHQALHAAARASSST